MASTGTGPPAAGGGAAPPSGPRTDGHRGRGRGRGHGRGRGRGDASRGRGGQRGGAHHRDPQSTEHPAEPASEEPKPSQAAKALQFKARTETQDGDGGGDGDGEAEACFICANPISHFAVAPCNYSTCHICALRLRALYKNKDCPHCRAPSPFVIFTDDGAKRFDDYTDAQITSTDDHIGIRYAGEDIVGDTVLLLQYNCPGAECDFAGLGWPDLHRHVRAAHSKKMCDLCTRHKKVFTHEHDMFTDKELTEHMRNGDDVPGASDQTGFRGHPLCGFCGARFYDNDKLFEHCRDRHERCFICDRRDSRQPHYYLDYNKLEEHFKKDHHICLDRECLEKKFVVFESEMDLKAHQLSEHGGSVVKGRDARTVDLSNFDLRQRYEQERRGPGGRDQQRRRGPDPNAEALPASSAQPLRRDQLAFQRQMALQTGGSQPAASPGPRPTPPAQGPPRAQAGPPIIDAMENLGVSDLSSLSQEQRANLTRHGAVIERAANLLGTDATKMAAFRSHISTYNRGSMKPEQLIDAFFALFSETSANALGTLVREVADLFQDKQKAEALRKAWQNWRAINEDYPSLPGLGGMHGATTSTTGWATAASTSNPAVQRPQAGAQQSRLSTRVLKLKNSTRRGSVISLGSSSTSSTSTPTTTTTTTTTAAATPTPSRPAAASTISSGRGAAVSATAFPSLPSARPAQKQQPNQPRWIGGPSTASASAPPTTTTTTTMAPPPRGGPGRKPSEDAFPALPAAPRPQTTIFGYGGGRATGFSWGGGAGEGAGAGEGGGGAGGGQGQGQGGKKKSKKQVLVHWG
ncbi:hypothetical protein BT67DRAFT_452828 [Trichocladium antarcticum]|uniref:RING-type E3 ubiquitin transferase n=1 Tax=Trichocladium antarcticum TaxID=1450529 RepID=A0AAN6UBG1_9PEZI|nr:hypothetical protein BT67DRAFT_452828 [Trichocladium antarcticum]